MIEKVLIEVENCRGGSVVCVRAMTRWWVKAAIWAAIDMKEASSTQEKSY